MKKLISGMFSSVPDAQLWLATSGFEEATPENAPDEFVETDQTVNSTVTNSAPDSASKDGSAAGAPHDDVIS